MSNVLFKDGITNPGKDPADNPSISEALDQLLSELNAGERSGQDDGWLSIEEVEASLLQ